MSINRWTDKETVTHTHTQNEGECYSDSKEKESLSFVKTWMNLEGVMLNEMSETGKT